MAKTYNFLIEVTPLNGTTPTTLRLTNLSADKNATTANGQTWLPCITSMPDTGLTLSADGLLDDLKIERGELSFFCSNEFDNHVWSSYVWNNAFYRAWYGENGTDYASYTLFGEGRTTNLERDGNQVTVRLLGPEADITSKLLTKSYLGTGNAEGPLGFKGNLKPRCFGTPLSVEPVEVDPVNLVYQVHGYGAVSAIQPYEYGLPLEVSQRKGNAASYAALIAMPLVPGEYATCLAEGMFRFGGTPTPRITADVTMSGGTMLSDIATAILTAAGVPAAKIGSFAAVSSVQTNLYVTSQVEALEALQSLFKQAGCYLFADKSGTWQCGKFYASTKSAVTLNSDRSTFPILLDWKEEPPKPPIKKVSYGFQRCWGVHSDSDASPIVNELAQQADNAALAAENAQNAADAAQTTADEAKTDAGTALNAVKDSSGNVIPSDQLKADIAAAAIKAQQLQDTYGSTASAAASANAAQTSATNAQTANANAQTAKQQAEAANSAAGAAKTAAETARSQAQTAATDSTAAKTAAESAKVASESARNQAQSAKTDAETAFTNSATAKTAAEAAKTAAETARTQAQTSATNANNSSIAAAGSASTASTKATDAGNSATAAAASNVSAASSYNDARLTSAALLPSDFSQDGRYWTLSIVGAPSAVNSLEAVPNVRWTFVDVEGVGRVGQVVGSNGNSYLSQVGVTKALAGRTYRLTAIARTLADSTTGFGLFLDYMDASYVQTGTSLTPNQPNTVGGEWYSLTRTITGDSLIANGHVYFRAALRNSGNSTSPATMQIASLRVEDITESAAASSSASAAATSASAASTSATNAGSSATSATNSANTATTKAGEASTSANNAATSATNASGSASAAQTSATTAAGSANTAGQKADAASSSASTASTKANEASQSATSAATSATTANTRAGAASTSATQAANSATAAGTSASNASTSATNAATSATNAGNSATAANTSAQTASTKATEAGNSASTATASSIAATSTYNAIQVTQANQPVLPFDFSDGLIQWSSGRVGSPATPQPVSGFSIVDGDADFGRACEMTWTGAGGNILTRGCMPANPGRYYEVRARFKIVSGDGAYNFNMICSEMDSSYVGTASNYRGAPGVPVTVTGEVMELSAIFTDQTSNIAGITVPVGRWTADARFMRFGLRNNLTETGMVVRVHSVRVSDVTDRIAAEQNASAALSSASSASSSAGAAATSATNAGSSANSAQTSATTASTKAGEASTSATQAASSETNANGSKNAAGTSATNAANSANAASGSATAAAGSASTASTQATNAGNSAAAAAVSSISANSAAISTLPFDFTNDGQFFCVNYTRAPADTVPMASFSNNNFTFADVAGVGRVLRAARVATSSTPHIAARGWLKAIAGHQYRVSTRGRVTANSGATIRVFGIGHNETGTQMAAPSQGRTSMALNTWYDVEVTFTGDDIIAAGGAYIRPLVRLDTDGTNYEIAYIRLEDITESANAAISASAAASSASSAGTSATNAGNSASSATTSANTATTKAGEAAGSASSAATSASNAASSSTNAGNSATAANGSEVSASLSAAAMMPSDFQLDGKFWQNGFSGLPTSVSSITPNSIFSFANVTGEGRVMRMTASSQLDVGNIGMLPLQPDRIYRFSARVRQTAGSSFAGFQLYRIGVNATGGTVGNGTVTNPSTTTLTALNEWRDISGTIAGSTVNAVIAAGASSIRTLLRLVASSSVTVEYSYIRIEDITESANAAGSASAAATSASLASASQNAAGSSASSAQTSATNAATQAGNAATSASNASTSASNAAGSANTASTQAGNASNSANAAAGSASSASNSASTASTKASEAGNSADTAMSQAIYAGSRAAGNFVAKPTYEDNSVGMWAGSVSVIADAVSAIGTSRALRSQTRDATEGDFIPLTASTARTFRVSGYAKCGTSTSYAVMCGIHGITTANTHNFIYTQARAAGQTSWAAFNFNIAVPANIAKFRPFIQSNNDGSGSVHDARVVNLTIEDITESAAASGSASAAASSASSASTSAGNAGSSATSATTSANTASTQAGNASNSANAAAGSAATATGAASTATTQASLTAQYSTGGGNLLSNTDFTVDTSGWLTSVNSQSGIAFPINGGGNEWHPEFVNALSIYQQSSGGTGYSDWTQNITVQPNQWYDVSVLVAAHRCQVQVYLLFQNAAGSALSTPSNGAITPSTGGSNLGSWTQVGFKGQAPADAVKARLYLRKHGTLSNQADSWAWFCRPQVRPTFANAPTPCSYSPGSGGAVAAALSATVNTQAVAIATASSTLSSLTSTVSGQGVTITNQQTAINTATNKANQALGRAAVTVDVGGRMTGWETNNNGATGNFKIHADNFSIEKPGGGARTEFANGCWKVFDENGVLRGRFGNLSA
ncbi:hypothetical protein KRZ98_18310 [Sphingobium sp. AS12]|uniref:hypothetical protein n=1 Tax=Sphingobium sp. AS12 TaxID=2849495 RepID=UPI001C31E217|nr:hypothetical protein [Sphingobium sp. AS12]MBV2150192.1 hypothetical protein [Sphingobium sp. AS12]